MKKTLLSGVSLIAALAAAGTATASGQWQGSYIGVSVGYGSDWARYEDSDYDWYGSTHAYYPDGLVYGLQGGRNWQDGNFVWGLEVDFLGTTIDRNQLFSYDNRVQNEVNWLATLRPRAGFGLGKTFIYQTAGIAVGDFDRSWTEFADPDDSWPDLGATKVGVAGGFGIERAIGGNWSVKAEALAMRFFENTSVNVNAYPLHIDDTVMTLKAGVNYAFGDRRDDGKGFVAGTPFDFTGVYIGLDLGGHMSTIQLSDIDYDYYGSTYDLLSNGLAGGIHGGFNKQVNGFVYGGEVAFNFFGGDDRTAEAGATPFNDSGLNWSGSLKVKAGAAADNTMMYLLAGYTIADYDLVRDEGDIWDLSGTHSGFIAGMGIEQAFTPNLSGRVEATYMGIDGDTSVSPTNTSPYRGAAHDVAVMAGVNYYMGDHAMGTGALAPANWAGFYAGVDGLFAYHQGAIFDVDYYDHGGTYTVPSFGAGGGVHAGVDWQNDTFVYGAIVDFALFTNDEDDTSPGYRRISSSLNWMGTLRGRAGVATGQALFYATGGVAFGDADLAYELLPTPDPDSFNFDSSRIGWTVGLGVEKAMSDRSSFKLETLFTRFGEEATFSDVPAGNICSDGFGSGPCRMLGYDDTITVKAGYSFRFSGM